MKAFTNITMGQLNEVQNILFCEFHAIRADEYPCDVEWDDVREYIHEVWGNEYDDDDIDFVLNTLCISPDFNHIYILEVQEDEYGVEHLHIETLYA